ncbi:MAG TPA: hypothetical protein VF794_22290 [Archangium sp.]|jgi:hypothetical protein|uniref:hypothetical protein n=1 Tax=Archangium sp. TaxID=1872627 RepID=UPI002ED9323C
MKLRSTLYGVAAVVVGGLLGCGQPPKYYRVAVDESPLLNLPASCYPNGTAPTPRTNNVQSVQQWSLWDGTEDRKYLEVGAITYNPGNNAPTFSIPGEVIVSTGAGDKTTFVAERTLTDPNRTYRVTYTFDKEGGLFGGDVIEGSIGLFYSCTNTATNNCNQVNSCDTTLRFTGRQIDAEPMLLVNG